MKTTDTRRRLQDALRSGDLRPVAHEFVSAMSAHHNGDEVVTRLSTKLLGRHAIKPGRKRNRGPSPYKLAIARAALWSRWNKGIGKDEAASQAAKTYGVPQQAVYRAAFERKDAEMNALIRELMSTPEKYNQG